MSIFDVEGGAGARTLRVRLPAFGEPARPRRAFGVPAWVPVRLSGQEGVNSLFSYELVLKAPEADGMYGASRRLLRQPLDLQFGLVLRLQQSSRLA